MDRGTAREAIEKNLKDNGWDANDLKEAFALVTNVNAEVPASANFSAQNSATTVAPTSVSPNMSQPLPVMSSPNLGSAGMSAMPGVSSSPMGGMPQAKTMASQFAQSSKPLPSFMGGMNMSGINPSPAQNFASVKPATSQTAKSGGVMGYVWTALIFLLLGAGGGFYASRTLFPVTQPVADYVAPSAEVNTPVQNMPVNKESVLPVSEIATTTTATTTASQPICLHVITKAKDPKTKIIKEFPTPCDVPVGWEVISPNGTSTSASPIKPATR